MKTIVHTLGYNIPELIEEATESLYNLNDPSDFNHIIIDLGYPLAGGRDKWGEIPDYIPGAKHRNLLENSDIASLSGSELIKLPNRGVSANWSNVAYLYGVGEGDVLIGADPDERPMDKGWVKAMADVMREDPNIAICSLMLPELMDLEGFFKNYILGERILAGHRVWYGKAMCQWALIGISGRFIEKAGGVPHPEIAPIYGWIETACDAHMKAYGMDWVMLPDFRVQHIASSPLSQEWKNYVVTAKAMEDGQQDFEQWLHRKA